MIRTLLSATLAGAIALTSLGAAPVYADSRDTQRLLGGLATIIILGATYDHFRDRAKRNQPVTRHAPSPRHEPRYLPRHEPRRAKIVPAQCLRSTNTRQGQVNYFALPCLRQTMHNVDRLPGACAFRVQGNHRPITGYGPRCLRNYGWRRG